MGIDVEVYEGASDLRPVGTGLSVMSNALSALRSLHIDLGLERRGQVIETFHLCDPAGRLLREMPLKKVGNRLGSPSVSIHRGSLQQALLDALGEPHCVYLGASAMDIAIEADAVQVRFTDGREAHGDVSSVRTASILRCAAGFSVLSDRVSRDMFAGWRSSLSPIRGSPRAVSATTGAQGSASA